MNNIIVRLLIIIRYMYKTIDSEWLLVYAPSLMISCNLFPEKHSSASMPAVLPSDARVSESLTTSLWLVCVTPVVKLL